MPPVPFRTALLFWLKLGFISFGGPAGQIAIMHRELVERRRWIAEDRYLHALNYCMLLPGPEAQQLATYMGWLMHGTLGGVVAGVLFVLPSLVLLIGLSWAYLAFGALPLVAGVFAGIKPAVAVLVVFAAHRIGTRALRHPALWALAAGSLIASAVFGVPFPAIVLAAALLGAVVAWRKPAATSATHTPLTRGLIRQTMIALGAGLALWAAALGALTPLAHTLTDMGLFFTRAALVTFGGAYAAPPYFHQGAVEQFGWLNATQMIDGLALGEATPGPLVIVVAFIGFVGGWSHQVLGAEPLFAGGALAALVATFFTFLPSFVFILAGAPLVEATHGKPMFTAPLTAIRAAVVGAIAQLALVLSGHVFWPAAGWDGFAILIGAAAAWALWRARWGVVPVLAAAGGAGALVALVRDRLA